MGHVDGSCLQRVGLLVGVARAHRVEDLLGGFVEQAGVAAFSLARSAVAL